MDRKNFNLYYLKIFMGLINFIILGFFALVFFLTLNQINDNFEARSFLENITYMPMEPSGAIVIMFVAFFLLLYIIEIRGEKRGTAKLSIVAYGIELLLCLLIIKLLYVTYNGILLLVVADIVTAIRDKHNRVLFLVIMGIIFIGSDYEIVSMVVPMISFQEFLGVYPAKISTMILGIKNILIAVNMIAFIAYMIILIK